MVFPLNPPFSYGFPMVFPWTIVIFSQNRCSQGATPAWQACCLNPQQEQLVLKNTESAPLTQQLMAWKIKNTNSDNNDNHEYVYIILYINTHNINVIYHQMGWILMDILGGYGARSSKLLAFFMKHLTWIEFHLNEYNGDIIGIRWDK